MDLFADLRKSENKTRYYTGDSLNHPIDYYTQFRDGLNWVFN